MVTTELVSSNGMDCSGELPHILCGLPADISWKSHSDLPSTLAELVQEQEKDQIVCDIRRDQLQSSSPLDHISFFDHQGVVYRRTSTRNDGEKGQLVVPQLLVPTFLRYFHNNPLGGHLGRLKTLLRVLKVAWWPNVRKDVWEYTRACENCQQYRANNVKRPRSLQNTRVTTPGVMLGIASSINQHHHALDQWNPESRLALNTAQQESVRKGSAVFALGRRLQDPLQRQIRKPPSPKQQAAFNLGERQLKKAEEVERRVQVHQARQARFCISHRKETYFPQGDLVWVRSPSLAKDH